MRRVGREARRHRGGHRRGHREHTRLLRRIDALLRDRDAERLEDPQRAEIIAIFDYWREKCGHPNSRFDGKRFDLIKARLRTFSADELRMAITVLVSTATSMGRARQHDRLGLIFESRRGSRTSRTGGRAGSGGRHERTPTPRNVNTPARTASLRSEQPANRAASAIPTCSLNGIRATYR